MLLEKWIQLFTEVNFFGYESWSILLFILYILVVLESYMKRSQYNSYRCRKWQPETQVQNLSGAVCISHDSSTPDKRVHSSILSPTMVKYH